MERKDITKSYLGTLLLLMLVLTTGCAGNFAETAKKKGIQTITIQPFAINRQTMRYGVDLSSSGQAGNILASTIVNSLGQNGVQRMHVVMVQNHIEVGEMIQQQLAEKATRQAGLQLASSPASGEGVLKVEILQYGYDNPGLFTERRCPMVIFRGELRDAKGKRIWSNRNKPIHLTYRDMGDSWEGYEMNPEKLRNDWKLQIDHMLNKLLVMDK